MHVFGSTATKLNLPNADVDVAIVNVEGRVMGRLQVAAGGVVFS